MSIKILLELGDYYWFCETNWLLKNWLELHNIEAENCPETSEIQRGQHSTEVASALLTQLPPGLILSAPKNVFIHGVADISHQDCLEYKNRRLDC